MSAPQIAKHLPLTPAVVQILLALLDQERHGYGIMQEVGRQTEGGMKMGPGTLYGSLKRMLAAGLIAESEERPDPALDDERRRYYRITGLGAQVVREEMIRLDQVLRVARQKHLVPGGVR